MKKNVFLILSIILLLLSIGTFGYLYYQNNQLEKEVTESNEKLKKAEESIQNDQQAITEKESEYEKLKDKVKESLEELEIWENLKDELNKSLS